MWRPEENVIADTLSRPPSSSAANVKEPSGSLAAAWQGGKPESSSLSMVQPTVCAVLATVQKLDFAAITEHQKTCHAMLQASKSSSLQLQAVEVMGVSLWWDISTGVPRPVIPVEDRRAVFNAFHGLAHAGARATRRLLAARVVWRGMNSDVAAWIRDCQQCCRGKVTTQPAAPLQPIDVPVKRFNHVHIDLVGPLPVAEDGSTYLLTVVDWTTRWLEAVSLRSMEAAVCADTFIGTGGGGARYGVPAVVTTDRGRQFMSAVWAALCQRLDIDHDDSLPSPEQQYD